MISNKISNHILLGFILVVLIAIALSAVAFSFHLKAVEIRNVTKMLDAAIETAWSQFEAKPLQLQTVLKEASREQVLKDAIRQKDYQALKELIRNWEEVYPNCDYFVIVDTDGKVLCRDSANRGDTWHLKSLARKGLASKETIVSTCLLYTSIFFAGKLNP